MMPLKFPIFTLAFIDLINAYKRQPLRLKEGVRQVPDEAPALGVLVINDLKFPIFTLAFH